MGKAEAAGQSDASDGGICDEFWGSEFLQRHKVPLAYGPTL